jgi:hypothetical protein
MFQVGLNAPSDPLKNCLAVSLSKSQAELKEEDCEKKLNYICEVKFLSLNVYVCISIIKTDKRYYERHDQWKSDHD